MLWLDLHELTLAVLASQRPYVTWISILKTEKSENDLLHVFFFSMNVLNDLPPPLNLNL
jgi:hypothetical protein